MNPVWHIHQGEPPEAELPISFALLLNLASAPPTPRTAMCCGASSAATRRTPRRRQHPLLDQLVGYAISYFHDFVKPAKHYRSPPTRSARRWPISMRVSAKLPKTVRAEEHPVRGLRRRQGAWLRAAARLVLRALRGAARPDPRAALRLVRRALRHRRDAGADRQGFGRRTGRGLTFPNNRAELKRLPKG